MRKLCVKPWILAHPIWLYILKKKFKNTTKYYNMFTILSFLGSKYNIFILFEGNATSITFLKQILNDKLLSVLNWAYY